jgi:hypothetical protein
MGHFKGDLKRELNKAGILTILVPGRLQDHLLDAVLFDGVAVFLPAGQHGFKLTAGRLGVAVQGVGPDQLQPAVLFKDLDCAVIQRQDGASDVADGDGCWKFNIPGG